MAAVDAWCDVHQIELLTASRDASSTRVDQDQPCIRQQRGQRNTDGTRFTQSDHIAVLGAGRAQSRAQGRGDVVNVWCTIQGAGTEAWEVDRDDLPCR